MRTKYEAILIVKALFVLINHNIYESETFVGQCVPTSETRNREIHHKSNPGNRQTDSESKKLSLIAVKDVIILLMQ